VRLALDTNVLAYAEGVNGAGMQERTLLLVEHLRRQHTLCVPAQATGELFNVLVRKAGHAPVDARSAVLAWLLPAEALETSRSVILAALDLATRHQLRIWDAVIVAAAAEAGCRMLLSEDLQDGFVWDGVTVVNPYAPTVHPLLASLLADPHRG